MKTREIKAVLKQLDRLPLPNREKILAVCPDPAQCVSKPSIRKGNSFLRHKRVWAVCIAAFLLLFGGSACVIAAEAQEYRQAVTFFETYDLPKDGLSRGEMKRVYRDITTGSFCYGKTAEVIEQTVGGYEIFQDEPTPEDLENLWSNQNSGSNYQHAQEKTGKNGIIYRFYSEESYHDKLGFDLFERSVLEQYLDGSLVWSTEFDSFWIEEVIPFDDQVLVYGQTPVWSSTSNRYAYLALVDADGTVLWKKMLQNGFSDEYIAEILPNETGIAVFSRGDLSFLCLSEYDLDGNLLCFCKNEVGNYGIWNAARLGDGYIVQLGNYAAGEYARLVKLDRNGGLTDSFHYTADDNLYFITDMAEYSGNVYLSAYAVPLSPDAESTGSRSDIAGILDVVFAREDFSISNKELTKLVREHFTAVLLICDPESGEPQKFFSVKGSLGGTLASDEYGNLLWNVERISDTYLSMATSSFTIGGASHIYRYTFDRSGKILSQEKTGEVADFRR